MIPPTTPNPRSNPFKDPRPVLGPQRRFTLLYVLAALALWWGLTVWWEQRNALEFVPYSQFEQAVREGRVAEVQVIGGLLLGPLKAPQPDGRRTMAAELVEPALAERLSGLGVPYRRVRESTWLNQLWTWFAPALIFFGVWYLLSQRLASRLGGMGGMGEGGLLGIGRSRAKVYMERQTGVRFEDVAGVDEAKAELQEIVDFLKDPQAHGRLGARMPKGVLLMGPTGTGKTLLARAVAGEAGVAFFSINGSEFIELFVGVGAARVRDLFDQARAQAPAIIFIDELDALGKARGAFNVTGGHDEREQTLNQLLSELDGFDPSVGVVLLAATNRPEVLDPALLRAGRFDRQVLVDRPDRLGRLAILRVHARKIVLAPNTDLDQVAGITVGLAGADLANVVNEAALAATRLGASAVTLEHFTLAIERIVAGIEKRRGLLSEPERRLVACHELGHALVALSLPGADRVHKVSIIPRGIGALGYTLQRPSEDRHVQRRGELLDRLTVLMAGRAAEQVVFGETSTGAADDLVKATDLARDMVLRYGMDEALGPVSWAGGRPAFLPELAPAPAQTGTAPATAQRADDAVRTLVSAALERAIGWLQVHREMLDRATELLLQRETLGEEELLALAGLGGRDPLSRVSAR
ncbi:MAG: ATP-dependent zinc metalloprotease FtsH [Betaproteobacteria bacterium]|jgi:cell division protease FtsH